MLNAIHSKKLEEIYNTKSCNTLKLQDNSLTTKIIKEKEEFSANFSNLLPKHIAIIMDGNSRWSKNNNLPKIEGYKKGIKSAEDIILFCTETPIKYLTLYTFSLENWSRPKQDIECLVNLLECYLNNNIQKLIDQNIKLEFIGNLTLFPNKITEKIKTVEKITCNNKKLFLNIALSYGSRQEITQAVCNIVNNNIKNITEDVIEKLLFTSNLPNVDLLIRPGGEKRLSNFLLWQLAYTELYFCDTLWPDFTCEHLKIALNEYLSRDRRYGR